MGLLRQLILTTETFQHFAILALLLASAALQAETSGGIVLFSGYPHQPEDILTGIDNPDVVGIEWATEWRDIQPERDAFDFTEFERVLDLWGSRGKFVDLRIMPSNADYDATPSWVFDEMDVERVAPGRFADFESATGGSWTIQPAAAITSTQESVIAGTRSLVAENATGSQVELLRYANADGFLSPAARVCVQFRARFHTDATVRIRLESASGTILEDSLAGLENSDRVYTKEFLLDPATDYQTLIILDGLGKVSIDNLHLVKPDRIVEDFERTSGLWIAGAGSQIINTPLAASGNHAFRAYNTTSSYTPALKGNPASVLALEANQYHRIRFSFHATQDTELRFSLTSQTGGARHANWWFVPAGTSGRKSLIVSAGFQSDFVPEWGLQGAGEILIDRIEILPYNDRTPEYPNIFSENLMQAYTEMLDEVASRYANHPALHSLSLGPIGRWDEMILNNDNLTELVPQWRAHGFTDEAYIEHIQWVMDLYESRFPEKKFQLQLAYGLNSVSDQEIMYRRVGGIAAERGILLKQNGLSARYDTWQQPGHASWVFNRFSHEPGFGLIHETGGQLYNNYVGAMGHPISLLNRGLMNGADYLYLYSVDLNTRNVERYFHFGAEQAGNMLPTVFENRLGRWTMPNDILDTTTDYYNQWLGLWQVNLSGPNPAGYTVIDGERAATTALGGALDFDLDDRWRYHGLTGAVLGVEYLDTGTDTLSVLRLDETASQYMNEGTATKENTGEWKRFVMPLGGDLDLARNSGVDPYRDLRIADNGDGSETIRRIALHAVPARGWQMTRHLDDAASVDHTIVSSSLSRDVTITPDQTVSRVSIPVYTNRSYSRTSITGRLYSVNGLNTELLTEREYALPWDGEWLDIPLPAPATGTTLRVELAQAQGTVGWYRNSSGELALRLKDFALALPMMPETTPVSLDARVSSILASHRPAAGIGVPLSGTGTVRVSVSRLIGELSDPLLEQEMLVDGTGRVYPLRFAPIPAVQLDVSLEPISGSVMYYPSETGFAWMPLQLQREPAANPERRKVPGEDIVRWRPAERPTFNTWSLDGPSASVTNRGDHLEFRLGNTPHLLTSPEGLWLTARETQHVGLRVKNETGATAVRLWWRHIGEEFSAERTVYIPLVPNDTEYRDCYDAVGMDDNWTGTIDQIRLEPITGLANAGIIRLESVAITDQPIIKQWTFDDDADIWTANTGVRSVYTENGDLVIDPFSSRAQVQSVQWAANFDARPGQRIRLRIKNQSFASQMQFFWRRKNRGVQNGYTLGLIPWDTEYREIEFTPTSGWNGTMVQFLMNPVTDGIMFAPTRIDEITILQSEVTISLPDETTPSHHWMIY